MRKIVCLILSALLLLSLAACSGGGEAGTTTTAAAPTLRVGYSKVSIVPKNPLALSSSKQPTYDAVYEDVYLTCIAITDVDDETILMFTTDISYCAASNQKILLRAAEEASGISVDNMFFSCTHNHSGLEPSGTAMNILKEAIAEASAAAMADRAPAALSIGTTQSEGMNFVRHYTTSDGYWVGDNYYSPTGTKSKEHEKEADPTIQLMHFERQGKDPVLLMNWQAHANYSYHMEHLCADFIGSLRTKVEQDTGCLFAYFQGAAGNLNPVSNLGLNKFERSLSGMTSYGQALAGFVIPALDDLTPVNGDDLDILHTTLTIQTRRSSSEIREAASAYRYTRENGGTHVEAIAAAGGLIHGDQGAEFVAYHTGETTDAQISAIRLGDVAFVVAPYEMFDDSGIYIRENSPFTMTFILGYTNGRLGYMPTQACVEHGCYEYEGSKYEAGTAELLADKYVEMLGQLNNMK